MDCASLDIAGGMHVTGVWRRETEGPMSLTSDMIARWQERLSGLEKIVADHESGRVRIDQEKADNAKLALKRLRTIVEAVKKD